MKSTVAAILLLACVAVVNSRFVPGRQLNTNINDNDNSNGNILFDFLVSIVESGSQKPVPIHKPRPPVVPIQKPRPPIYKPVRPIYKPTTEYYQEQTTEYHSKRPSYSAPVPIHKPCKYCSTYPTSDDSGEKPFGINIDDLFDFRAGNDAKSGQKSNEAMQVASGDAFQSQTNFRGASPQSESSKMQEFEN